MSEDRAIDFEDIQGLIVRGYGHLPHACYLLFRITSAPRARQTLASLADEISYGKPRPGQSALNIALTCDGLEALKIQPETIAAFSDAFRTGMDTPHKRRILGDESHSAPETWVWGGPKTAKVHGVFAVFCIDSTGLENQLNALEEKFAGGGLATVKRLSTHPTPEPREHFGFRDAIGQPYIAEFDPLNRQPAASVPLGEFVLGYPNGYGRYTRRPMVKPESDPDDQLADDPEQSGLKDLGFNGSYLVFRQLAQDVQGFWQYMKSNGKQTGGAGDEGAIRLASLMVGRWPSGAPLVLTPEKDDPDITQPDNFFYHDLDADGHRCPLGAHIRRTNPRDSLDPEPGSQASVDFSNRHRLLRRGRIYGTPLHEDFSAETFLRHVHAEDHGGERGLHFLCMGANIQRQFEFVQHTWANNPTFNGLYDDPDPIIGPRRTHGRSRDSFTEQSQPARCRYQGLPEFVRTRGGAYFFIPSRRALLFLAGPAA